MRVGHSTCSWELLFFSWLSVSVGNVTCILKQREVSGTRRHHQLWLPLHSCCVTPPPMPMARTPCQPAGAISYWHSSRIGPQFLTDLTREGPCQPKPTRGSTSWSSLSSLLSSSWGPGLKMPMCPPGSLLLAGCGMDLGCQVLPHRKSLMLPVPGHRELSALLWHGKMIPGSCTNTVWPQ